MLLELHFTENAFALELFLQSPKGLIDIVVANTNLHVVVTTFLGKSCKDLQETALYQPSMLLSTLQSDSEEPAMTDKTRDPKDRLLDAALSHVPFDGWSEATFTAALRDTDIDRTVGRALFPRGAVDLAMAYHQRGDTAMQDRIATADLGDLRFRDKIATAVRWRIEAAEDREVVRRGTALFALPHHAADGAKLIWQTSDAIWNALGDTSDDINWYTKRATLAGVYSATVLFWLGDTSAGYAATWDFLDRRIDDVMQIEKLKAQVRESPTLSRLMSGPNWLLSHIKAPTRAPRAGLPGSWTSPRR